MDLETNGTPSEMEVSETSTCGAFPSPEIRASLVGYYAMLLGRELKGLGNFMDSLENVMFGRVSCSRADLMVDLVNRQGDAVVVRKRNNLSVRDFLLKIGDRLLSFHFGALYSHDMAMRDLVEGFKVDYRLFCLDFDADDTGEEYWWSQLVVVQMTMVDLRRRFGMRGVSDLVCFSGGGWHGYYGSDRMATDPSREKFEAVMKNVERQQMFQVDGKGYARGLDGYFKLAPGVVGDLDFLFKENFEEQTRYVVLDLYEEERLLAKVLPHFPQQFKRRFRRWMEPKGVVASVLVRMVERAGISLRAKTMVQRMVNDIDGGNFRSFEGFKSALNRVVQFTRCNGEGNSVFFERDRALGVLAYFCLMADCVESGLHVDFHMANPSQPLRGVFSPKVKPGVVDPGAVYVSCPVGWNWYGLERKDGSLTLREACEEDNLKVERGMRLFREFALMVKVDREMRHEPKELF